MRTLKGHRNATPPKAMTVAGVRTDAVNHVATRESKTNSPGRRARPKNLGDLPIHKGGAFYFLGTKYAYGPFSSATEASDWLAGASAKRLRLVRLSRGTRPIVSTGVSAARA